MRHPAAGQPPREKCDAKLCANAPNPPRVTPPESESAVATWFDEESPLKKPERDDDPPDPPWPPPEEEPRGGHSAPDCASAAIPGRGPQFSLGISA